MTKNEILSEIAQLYRADQISILRSLAGVLLSEFEEIEKELRCANALITIARKISKDRAVIDLLTEDDDNG